MRIEIPLPSSDSRPSGSAGRASSGSGAYWRPLISIAKPAAEGVPTSDGEGFSTGGRPDPSATGEATARYFERLDGDREGQRGLPCLLMISPLLPLPRSLPALIQETLTGEPDFRLDWKWPVLTPRVGPWELVVQMCIGTSQATGHTTGRIYVALDAGFGVYLIVCIDRDPKKLAERQKELLALMAEARLYEDRRPSPTGSDADGPVPSASSDAAVKARAEEAPTFATLVIPRQQPPPEIYLKEALFAYLAD